MTLYYVNINEQANGDHEVHAVDSKFLPDSVNRIYFGGFSNCCDAAAEARRHHQQVNGCFYCSKECHTG